MTNVLTLCTITAHRTILHHSYTEHKHQSTVLHPHKLLSTSLSPAEDSVLSSWEHTIGLVKSTAISPKGNFLA